MKMVLDLQNGFVTFSKKRNWHYEYTGNIMKHCLSKLRGLFKKFCYERLSICKDKVCLTDFVHKYSSFLHTCTCEISKESGKYQYSYWHLKWPQSYTLAYIWRWKGWKRWTRRCYLHKKSCCDEKFAPKKGWGTNFWE